MQDTDLKPLFVFVHMTKTAGGSLRYAIEELPRNDIIYSNNVVEAEQFPKEVLANKHMLYGHLCYGMKLQTDRPLRYITFMRHPVTRVISHFNQLLKVDEGRIGKRIQAHPDINDFFRESFHWEFNNFMTTIITGTANVQMSDVERFEMAVRVINKDYAFVGVQELFDLSLLGLRHEVNMNIQVKTNYNLGSWSLGEANRQTLAKIIKLNQADLMLYRHVMDRLLASHTTLDGLLRL